MIFVKTWASFIIKSILYNLDRLQTEYWNKLDKFFDEITMISGGIKTKTPKEEKIKVIHEKL